MARSKKLTPNKSAEAIKPIEDTLSKTSVSVHNLSPLSPPSHKPNNRLTDSFTETNAVDFIFGYNFPKEVITTGKKTHDDHTKLFKK